MLMPAGLWLRAARQRITLLAVLASRCWCAGVMTAVTPVTPVTENVHRDKGDENHYRKPIRR